MPIEQRGEVLVVSVVVAGNRELFWPMQLKQERVMKVVVLTMRRQAAAAGNLMLRGRVRS